MGGLLFAQASSVPGLWFTVLDLITVVNLEMLRTLSLYLNTTGLVNWRLPHPALVIYYNTQTLLCKTAMLAVILSSACEADEERIDLFSVI